MTAPTPFRGDSLRLSDTSGLSRARRAVADAAAPVIGPDRVADLQLVVSELLTNALEYGEGEQVVVDHGQVGEDYVVSVTSVSADVPVMSDEPVPGDLPAGRGLLIVEAIADGVTIETVGRETVVTCRFARASAA